MRRRRRRAGRAGIVEIDASDLRWYCASSEPQLPDGPGELVSGPAPSLRGSAGKGFEVVLSLDIGCRRVAQQLTPRPPPRPAPSSSIKSIQGRSICRSIDRAAVLADRASRSAKGPGTGREDPNQIGGATRSVRGCQSLVSLR